MFSNISTGDAAHVTARGAGGQKVTQAPKDSAVQPWELRLHTRGCTHACAPPVTAARPPPQTSIGTTDGELGQGGRVQRRRQQVCRNKQTRHSGGSECAHEGEKRRRVLEEGGSN